MGTKKEEEEEEYYFHKVDFIESQKSCFTQTKPLKKAAVITTTSLPLDGPSFMQRASSWSAISAPLNFRRVGKRQLKEILREAVANDSPRHSCKQKRFKVFQDSLGIPDSTHWIVESGFRIPIVRGILCSLNLIPKPRVLESKSNNLPDSGNWTPSLGVIITSKASDISQAAFCYVKCATS